MDPSEEYDVALARFVGCMAAIASCAAVMLGLAIVGALLAVTVEVFQWAGSL